MKKILLSILSIFFCLGMLTGGAVLLSGCNSSSYSENNPLEEKPGGGNGDNENLGDDSQNDDAEKSVVMYYITITGSFYGDIDAVDISFRPSDGSGTWSRILINDHQLTERVGFDDRYIGQTFSVELGMNHIPYGYSYSINSGTTSAISSGPVKFSFVFRGDTTIHINSHHKTTVLYEANGGSGSTIREHSWVNATISVSDCSFTRDHYTFLEWNTNPDGTGVGYGPGDRIQLADGGITLYAQWEWVVFYYTYTYYSNPPVSGVAEESFTETYEEGATATRPLCPWDFSSYYFYFDGWSGFSSKVTSNRTINATWYYSPPVYTYYITYHANYPDGSDETSSQSVKSNSSVSIRSESTCGFGYTGYTFSHWTTSSGKRWDTGDTYYGSDGGVTLYAQWKAKVFTVNLNKNGGDGGTSTIYLKYNSGWYSNSSCTNSITSITKPTRTGWTFNGYNESANGTGTTLIDADGNITASKTFYYTSGTKTIYAMWLANNQAYYDDEGGYWYVEAGKMPQSKVSDSLKSTLSSNWTSLSTGDIYYFAGMTLTAKVYNSKEYCEYNEEYYLVEPIRWRLEYSSNQTSGYGTTDDTLAIMATIVYVDQFSDVELNAGAGYSSLSVTGLLNNITETGSFVTETKSLPTFGSTSLNGTAKSVSGNMFVASYDDLSNFTTNKNGSEKLGKIKFSDLAKDYLRANGKDTLYYTRDLGTNYNNIFCMNGNGDRVQYKANNMFGVQFSILVTEFACVE